MRIFLCSFIIHEHCIYLIGKWFISFTSESFCAKVINQRFIMRRINESLKLCELSPVHIFHVSVQDGSYFKRVPVPDLHTQFKTRILVCQKRINLNVDLVPYHKCGNGHAHEQIMNRAL